MMMTCVGELLVCGRSDVVDLQDHFDELGGEQNLLLLGVQRLDHVVLLHVGVSAEHAVDAEGGAVFGDLA